MKRRGFLGAILAAGVAPAVAGSGILMPVRQLVLPRMLGYDEVARDLRRDSIAIETPPDWINNPLVERWDWYISDEKGFHGPYGSTWEALNAAKRGDTISTTPMVSLAPRARRLPSLLS